MKFSTSSAMVLVSVLSLGGCRSSQSGGDYVAASGRVDVPPPAPTMKPVVTPPAPVARVTGNETPPQEAPPQQASLAVFDTPEAAMLAVAGAAESGDHDKEVRIFGQGCQDMIDSDDTAADNDDCRRVAAMIREHLEFEDGAAGHKS